MKAARTSGPKLISCLVGNKSELRDGTIDSRAEVSIDDATNFAAELGLTYFETSAVIN